jgi:tRNA(fMet)-specific endonuclease VapC
MIYCLDTNTIIYYLKEHPNVVRRLQTEPVKNLCTTVVSSHELYVGAYRSKYIPQTLARYEDFLSHMIILSVTDKSAKLFGYWKAKLWDQGQVIEDFDIVIASICLENSFTLVTSNTKHFQKINDLKIEDWTV